MTKSIFELTDEELEDCIDGSTNLHLLREIFSKPDVVNKKGLLNIDDFAQWFAIGLEGYIDADEDTDEWYEIYDQNQLWGEQIAESINDYLAEE